MQPKYHCKSVASAGDMVRSVNIIGGTQAVPNEKLYLVLGVEEDYEGFKSPTYADFLEGKTESQEHFVWYAFLLAASGKVLIEKLQYLRKVIPD